MLFENWDQLIRTLVMGFSSYLCLVVLLRASGKRTLSKMNMFDFVVTIALGSTLASVIISKNVTLSQGVLALGLLIFLQFAITFLEVRSPWFRSLVKAQPTLLFYQGKFDEDALKRERVAKAEAYAAMRESGTMNLDKVAAIILETDGTISVIKGDELTSSMLDQHHLQV